MLSESSILDIEEYITNSYKNIFHEFTCRHTDIYKTQTHFKFLPGHRLLLLSLPNHAMKISPQIENRISTTQNQSFSVVLNELIKTAELNSGREMHHVRYSDIVRYFSTVIFLLGGKNLYETLVKNLPIPSSKTIRE